MGNLGAFEMIDSRDANSIFFVEDLITTRDFVLVWHEWEFSLFGYGKAR
jgi:hypothetical protein